VSGEGNVARTLVGGRPEGGRQAPVRHYKRPLERPFTRAERGHVHILVGGLTERHNRLIYAAGTGLGYQGDWLPTPMKTDYETGREYANPGMCNPACFTIGALINYLKGLREEQGLSAQEIVRDYVFVTAGSLGPCRFGTYESEYRLALDRAGFEGFRVLLFQQKQGWAQSGEDAGLELDARLATVMLTAAFMADLLNDLAHQIRPYELVPGQTNRVFERAAEDLGAVVHEWAGRQYTGGPLARLLARRVPGVDASAMARLLDLLLGDGLLAALRRCARKIDEGIEVDYTRPKPACKMIGEFWAQRTEGDGNFGIFSFLESEGAEVVTEPLAAWFNYLLASAQWKRQAEHGLRHRSRGHGGPTSALRGALVDRRGLLPIRLGRHFLGRQFNRMRDALGGIPRPLADQEELRRLAQPYYNPRLSGGEGHLEVGETLHYGLNGLAHLIVSLKPFGCLPSTQSDGAHAAVLGHYPQLLFLPLETTGDGGLGARSRIRMALGDAKLRCREEFDRSVAETGRPIEAIRAYCRTHRQLRRPLQRIPRQEGTAGRAASFVKHVAGLMAASAPAKAVAETHSGVPIGAARAAAQRKRISL